MVRFVRKVVQDGFEAAETLMLQNDLWISDDLRVKIWDEVANAAEGGSGRIAAGRGGINAWLKHSDSRDASVLQEAHIKHYGRRGSKGGSGAVAMMTTGQQQGR